MSFLIPVSHVSAAFNCSDMLDRLILIERWIQTAQQVMRACRSNHCQGWLCSLHSDLMNMLVCNTICIIAAYSPVCPGAWENHLEVYVIYNVYIYFEMYWTEAHLCLLVHFYFNLHLGKQCWCWIQKNANLQCLTIIIHISVSDLRSVHFETKVMF